MLTATGTQFMLSTNGLLLLDVLFAMSYEDRIVSIEQLSVYWWEDMSLESNQVKDFTLGPKTRVHADYKIPESLREIHSKIKKN